MLNISDHDYSLFEYDHSEVISAETWRSLLLVSTRSGVWLQDLDNKDVSDPLITSSVNLFAGLEIVVLQVNYYVLASYLGISFS